MVKSRRYKIYVCDGRGCGYLNVRERQVCWWCGSRVEYFVVVEDSRKDLLEIELIRRKERGCVGTSLREIEQIRMARSSW